MKKEKGGKSKKLCEAHCQRHNFVLKPIRTDTFIKNEIRIDFCPIMADRSSKSESIHPVFTNDNLPYLPSFILDVYKNDYDQNRQRYIEEHKKKIEDYTTKKKELLEPRPGRRHNNCGVCKMVYED